MNTESTSPPPSEEEKYTSDDLTLTIKRGQHCNIELIASCKKNLLDKAHKKSVKRIAKEASIPGFRKGKAPEAILMKKYPKAVEEQKGKELVDIAFEAAQKLHTVPVLNGNSKVTYNLDSLSSDEGIVSFKFETEPSIPDVDPHALKLTDEKSAEIGDEKVNDVIKQIQLFYAEWKDITDRSAQVGDYVTLDIDDLDSDPPRQAFSNARFEINEKSMATWMRELTVGLSVGDSAEGVSKPEDSDSDEIKESFQPKKVKLTLKTIQTPIYPEADDALAKKVGVQTIDEARVRLKELLTKQESEKRQHKLREHLADLLLKTYPFDVPASLLENEANHRMQGRFREPSFQKTWRDMSDEEKESMKNEIKTESIHAIQIFYLCRKIAQAKNLKLDPGELDKKPESTLDAMFSAQQHGQYQEMSEEQKSLELSRLMLSKAQDALIDEIAKEGHLLPAEEKKT